MTKKILLSVAASALLTTAAFAGTVSLPELDHSVITTESYVQNGMDVVDFGQVIYTAGGNGKGNNFNVQPRSGGSISDPMIAFDVSNLQFPYHQTGPNTVEAGFGPNGKGLSPIALRKILEQDDKVKDLLENDYFNGTSLIDVDDNSLVAEFDQLNFEKGKAYIQYDGSSATEVKNQHSYKIVDDNNAPVEIPVKLIRKRSNDLGVILYSQTLDDNKIDTAVFNASITLKPQFKVACVRKFDGLINFENDRVSFVNPAHGERIGNKPADTANDTLITSDRMIFTIENNRDDAAGTRWMGGHGTQFTFTADNNDNKFENWTDSTVKVYTADPAKVDTDNTASTAANATYTLAAGTKDTATPGSFVFDAATKEFTVTYDNALLPAGKTSFVVDLIKPDDTEPLREVKFVAPTTDLEGGLPLGDNATIDDQNHGGADHAVVNTVDSEDIITPRNQTAPVATDAGEWMDHAYIAQIAGATQDANVLSKFFIVNRSCAPVTPTFKLIKDGKVTEVKGTEIGVNTQSKVLMSKLLADAGLKDGRYAVEIILPGVAEDFYIYAQSLTAAGSTKDLPVYNTSNRD